MQPIFILTCERSGSTLLRCLIDTHPDIYSPGEINIGPLCQSLSTTILYTKGQSEHIKTESERIRVIIDEIRSVIKTQLSNYTNAKGKKTWCDKAPINIQYLDLISQVFPESKFICLYRNCLDVVWSCISFSKMGFMLELCEYVKKNPENLVAAMIDSWSEKTEKILNFERSGAFACFRVTYESLVSDTADTLSKLYKFLEVSDNVVGIDAIFSNGYEFGQMNGDLKILFSGNVHTESIGKGSEIPRTFIPEDYYEKIFRLHSLLGYPQCKDSLFDNYEPTVNKKVSVSGEQKKINIKDIIEQIFKMRLQEKGTNGPFVQGIFCFTVTGDGGGEWFFDFNKEPMELRSEGDISDCSLSCSSRILIEMIEGRLSLVEAYEAGYIGASGNINMAINVGRALFSDF